MYSVCAVCIVIVKHNYSYCGIRFWLYCHPYILSALN